MKAKVKSSKVNRAWLNDHVNDPYVKLARLEGYRARAVYKLKEIDETLHLIKPGQLVIDLGSAPGAWSQYLRRRMSPKTGAGGGAVGQLTGVVIALDMLAMEPVEGVLFLQGDFREAEIVERLVAGMHGRLADVVLSDMAPNLSGIAAADAAAIESLVELAIDFAQSHLARHGVLVAKVFQGAAYERLVRRFQEVFDRVKRVKPKASRDRSTETFLVGVGLKAPPTPHA